MPAITAHASQHAQHKEKPNPLTFKHSSPKGDSFKQITPTLSLNNHHPLIIAGPCSLESFDQTLQTALAVKHAGAHIFRGSAFKPRTNPYDFQGFGLKALEWHKAAQKIHKLPIETEVICPSHIELVANYVDILRIGMRNMQNYSLLQEAGKTGLPIILKRNASATLKEWLLAAEYILCQPNSGTVILCERGIRTFENSSRYTLDLSTALIAKETSCLPVIVDPSHAAGDSRWVLPLAKAALALGIDGLIIEVHPTPQQALSDANQQITPQDFHLFMNSFVSPFKNMRKTKLI